MTVPQSLKVATTLLIRIVNDIRSIVLLATRGYAVQAVSLTSSVYETAFTVAYIGRDNYLAQQWTDHDDPNVPFRPAKELTREALKRLEIENWETHLRLRYRVYRQMCMGKHAHPLLQQQLGYKLYDRGVLLTNGPDLSEAAIQVLWFALEHAVFLATVAVTSFGKDFASKEVHQTLLDRIFTLHKHREELALEAQKRGYDVDALAEKWKP